MQTNLEVSSLITPILDGLKYAKNEIKALLEIGIPEYLQSQTQKYYFTNTFLHREQKVRFDDIYFPVSVKYDTLTTKLKNVRKTLEEYKFITIVGSAGSGKSTLIKYIFLNSIRRSYKIPILIELRYLNDYNGSIEEYIFKKILKNNVKPSSETLKKALKSGAFLFLFDGYDEIFSDKKQRIANEIDEFTDIYPENRYIITTRPGSGIEAISRFHLFHIQNLSNKEIEEFIDLIVANVERRKQIKSNINKSEVEDYKAYLQNPLLLSMFILAFESHPEIPSRKSAFYKNVFDTLYSKHDGVTKGSFPREKKTKLKREDFEEILSAFSFTTFAEGKFAFTEEYLSEKLMLIRSKRRNFTFEIEDLIFDLRTSISIMLKDGFEYKFPHRSMQEYFTAYFISKLPTDKKRKAYKKLRTEFLQNSEDYSFNFWKLCKELDYTNYYKNFILIELKGFLKHLKKFNDSNLIQGFFKLYEPIVALLPDRKKEQEENEKSWNLWIARSANLYNSIIDSEDIYEQEFFSIVSDDESQEEFLKIINFPIPEEWRINMIGKEIKDKKAIDLIVKNGGLEIIKDYIEKIQLKIRQIESELSKDEENLDDFLNA